MLTHLIAHHCGLEADEFIYSLGNAHIYESHMDSLSIQLTRTPLSFPRIRIQPSEERKNIEDYVIEDIDWITPYSHHPTIKMNMIA